MKKTSINLPGRKVLHLSLAKRRGATVSNSIKTQMSELLRVRKGSKVSRLFRHVFEHKNIKKFFGANMAIMIMASSLAPTQVAGTSTEYEATVVSESEVPLSTEKIVTFPVDTVVISQGYSVFHPAFDFDGLTGDPIYSIKDGVVETVEYSKYAYGNAILIRHEDNLTSLYAHLSEIYVEKGDVVETGDVIGEMGATGRAFGDHLHFEIRKNGIPVYPYSILPRY